MNGRTNSNGVGTDILQVPLDPPENLTATAGNAKVSLTWVDPVDKYATPEGETAQDPQQLVSEWDYTVVVRKVGSQPNDPNDGTVVTKSSIRNQYQTSPYEDTGLINDTVYYYGVFAVNKDGVASDGTYDNAIPKNKVAVSTLLPGTIVYLNENGVYTEYIVIHQGLPSGMYDQSCNGSWLLRQNIHSNQAFSRKNDYENSSVHSYINNTIYNLFDSDTKDAIKEVKIPYVYYTSNTGFVHSGDKGLQCKLFLLSGYEVNDGQETDMYADGSALTLFTNTPNTRIAYYNGTPSVWWLRTPSKLSLSETYIVSTEGEVYDTYLASTSGASYNRGVRPALILEPDTLVNV